MKTRALTPDQLERRLRLIWAATLISAVLIFAGNAAAAAIAATAARPPSRALLIVGPLITASVAIEFAVSNHAARLWALRYLKHVTRCRDHDLIAEENPVATAARRTP